MPRVLRRRRMLILLAGGLLIIPLVSWGATRGANGLERLDRLSNTIRDLEPKLDELEGGSIDVIEPLQNDIRHVEEELRRAKSELTPFVQVASLLGWVPKGGDRLRNAKDVLSMSEDMVSATEDLLTAADNVIDSRTEESASLLEENHIPDEPFVALTEQKTLFRSALSSVEDAQAHLERLKRRDLPQDFREIVGFAQRVVPDLEGLARTGLAFSNSWRSFLGYEDPRDYLLVAQNSDELRATGGFIPGAWLLTLSEGEIVQLNFWDSVAVDNLEASPSLPPEGLLQSLWAGVWVFRDASWYPDFPSSAKAMEQIVKLGQGISVDGVIAMDQWVVKDVLKALGPVVLPTGETLDPDSYIPLLEQKTDVQGHQFMDTIFNTFLDRLRKGSSGEDLFGVLGALNKSLDQKHMLLSFHDPGLQEVASINGWDGALGDVEGDYLMVVDSNVGFSKVNRSIEQHIRYQVELNSDGRSEARLDVLNTNNSLGVPQGSCEVQAARREGLSYEQHKNTCYWDYLRVYLPRGSVLQTSTPFPMPEGALYRREGYNDVEDTLRIYSESGREVVAGFFNLEVGQSRSIAFVYDLPSPLLQVDGKRQVYSLLLHKQPGTQNTPVDVIIQLPSGYRVRNTSPEPIHIDDEEARFSVDLDSDTTIEVILEEE